MKTIKIYPCVENASTQKVRNLLGIKDESVYGWKFELSNEPQYLIVTELIYYNDDNYKLFRKLAKRYPNAIRIFRTGECVSPDFNMFDYAIVFDRDLRNGDRVCRIPFNRYFAESLIVSQDTIPYRDKIKGEVKFCNFMYSNANAHPNRDKLFYSISEYRTVDSIGKHLNNTGIKSTRYNEDWRKISIDLRKPYKFSIASENATFRGYVSEKLISCLQAGTIAIYWGDPSIGEDFNTKSFINCHEYPNFAAVVERVKEIDQNDDLWVEIASSPWQTEEQIEKMRKHDDEYIKFIKNIFDNSFINAKRRPGGTFTGYYSDWILSRRTSNKLILKIKSHFRNKFKSVLKH